MLDFVSLLVLFIVRPREAMNRIREHVSPIAQPGHWLPPQLRSVSSPLTRPSLHDAGLQTKLSLQTPLGHWDPSTQATHAPSPLQTMPPPSLQDVLAGSGGWLS